jgi:geranylgeranyl diphosphate synthase, type II
MEMQPFDSLLTKVNKALKAEHFDMEPRELYESIAYTLALGGKRIRPVMVLMACDLFKGNIAKALNAAIAIEVFHNFTLIHDDIMDKAPIRRGKESVYKKWDTNVAILAGDTMQAKAVEYLLRLDDVHLKPVLGVFTSMAIDVCEGQQFDMNYENAEKVSIDDYISMIRLKTAALIGASLRIGAIIANAEEKDALHIEEFGRNLGVAFQLKDDLLDVFGDEKKFGKKTGNDIATNKKTFLYLKAFEQAKGQMHSRLLYYFVNATLDPDAKIAAVKDIYIKLKIKESAEKAMDKYYKEALKHLDAVKADPERKTELRKLADKLMVRET